jgi:hypothetical protein
VLLSKLEQNRGYQMRQNSISKYKSLFTSVAFAICSTSLMATDTYDPATNQLSIPSVKVGTATYNNVVITVGSIVSIGGASSTQSAEGLWSGLTSTGYEVNSLVLENNEFWNIIGRTIGNVFYVVAMDNGAASVNGNNYSTFFREYTGNASFLGYSTGTVTTNSKITGTSTIVGTTSQSTTVSLTPPVSSVYNYNKSADISEVTGIWSGNFLSGYSGIVQVLANGQVSGITNGCNFSGSFSPRSTGKNVFDFSLVNGTGCFLPGFKSSGIAISYLTSSGKRQLIAGSTDATKTQGDLFFAQR